MISRFTFLCSLMFAISANCVQAQYIYTFAGNGYGAATGVGSYTGDGHQARSAELNSCTGVGYDGAGNIFIADRANNVIRKVAVTGIITTYAGKDSAGYSGDNGYSASAKLNKPYSVVADVSGNIYISDGGNNVIRKVSVTNVITTIAGTGTAAFSGDGGQATAAELNGPQGIAIDSFGNLYIADTYNNRIRKILPNGIILTVAGNSAGSYTGDLGLATLASLNAPAAVAADPYGQLYIADYLNNVVRKVDTQGIITTYAGTGALGFSGDGGPASQAHLHYPAGVSVFGFGPVYISDEGNNSIRMVSNSGIISTYAGSFTNGYTGDGGFAVNAELSSPKGIAVNSLNDLYIADYDNNVIRVVSANTGVNNVASAANGLKVYPNPSNGAVSIEVPGTGSTATLTVSDIMGRTVIARTVATTIAQQATVNVDGLPAGSYIVKVVSGDNAYRGKVVVY